MEAVSPLLRLLDRAHVLLYTGRTGGIRRMKGLKKLGREDRVLLGSIFTLAWPAMLEQALQTVVQYADSAMVGQLGAQSTAAVGITTHCGGADHFRGADSGHWYWSFDRRPEPLYSRLAQRGAGDSGDRVAVFCDCLSAYDIPCGKRAVFLRPACGGQHAHAYAGKRRHERHQSGAELLPDFRQLHADAFRS